MESNPICQYCHEPMNNGDSHLDYCNVYKSIMMHLNSSNSSEEELPSTHTLYDIQPENSRLYSKAQVFPLRPVKKPLKACPNCKSKYENSSNLPYLLPACGHTFCKNCLSRMSYKSMIRCALCNAMTYKELKKLPVNYALVEAFETANKKPKCRDHNSEIMAYCNSEDTLLCGSCMFAHRSHEVYLLTDPKIQVIANSKKGALKKQEQELIELKTNWEKAKEELQQGLNELKVSADKHKNALEGMEEKLIMKIIQGCNHCIQEISKFGETEDYIKVKKKIRENIAKIGTRLQKIREMKEQYDVLPIVEKLKKPLESETVDNDSPPSLSPIGRLMEKLKGMVDYESCIKKNCLKIS